MSRNLTHPSTSEPDTQTQTFDPNRHEKLKFTGRFFKWLLTAPLPDARKQDVWVDTLPPGVAPPSQEPERPRASDVPVRSMTREEAQEVQTFSPQRASKQPRSKIPLVVVGSVLFGAMTATAVMIMQRSEARVSADSGETAGDQTKSAGQQDTEGPREGEDQGDAQEIRPEPFKDRQEGPTPPKASPIAPKGSLDSKSAPSDSATKPPMNSKPERSKVTPPSGSVVSKGTTETPSSGSSGPNESTSHTESDRPKSNPFQPRQ